MITYYNHKTLDVMICFSTMTAIATKNEIFNYIEIECIYFDNIFVH